jgi:hypothetical protein
MPTTALFPLPEELEMTSISDTAEELLVRVTSHRANWPVSAILTETYEVPHNRG